MVIKIITDSSALPGLRQINTNSSGRPAPLALLSLGSAIPALLPAPRAPRGFQVESKRSAVTRPGAPCRTGKRVTGHQLPLRGTRANPARAAGAWTAAPAPRRSPEAAPAWAGGGRSPGHCPPAEPSTAAPARETDSDKSPVTWLQIPPPLLFCLLAPQEDCFIFAKILSFTGFSAPQHQSFIAQCHIETGFSLSFLKEEGESPVWSGHIRSEDKPWGFFFLLQGLKVEKLYFSILFYFETESWCVAKAGL